MKNYKSLRILLIAAFLFIGALKSSAQTTVDLTVHYPQQYASQNYFATDWIIIFRNVSTSETYYFQTDHWGEDRSEILSESLGTIPTGSYDIEFDGADYHGYDYYVGGSYHGSNDDLRLYNIPITVDDGDIIIDMTSI